MRKPTRTPNIIEFTTDPKFLGLSLSEAQETLLRAIYGLPLSDSQMNIYRLCTGRESYTGKGFAEATIISGARSGKDSRIAAPVIVYEALFGGHEKNLARGERATIPLVAQDQRATRIAFSYVKNYLMDSAGLRSTVEEVLSGEIRLMNGITIFCFPCTKSSLRGWSIPVGVMDELGFFELEGQADSDIEIQTSIRRGMVNFPNPKLIKISTPYMRSGILYDDFKNYFGKDSEDVLLWKSSSALMNPTLKAGRLEREKRLDPERYMREFEAEFVEDLEAFLPSAWIEAAIIVGCYERQPLPGMNYAAACDPSGGGADSFTLCIVHTEGEQPNQKVVQDVCRGWKRSRGSTIDLESVVTEIAAILKGYGIGEILGDRYAGQWVRQAFEREGISYREAEEKSKYYLELEPLFSRGQIELLDHPQLVRELRLLERRPRPGGRTVVDHPSGGHDDHSNSLALAATQVLQGGGSFEIQGFGGYVRPDWGTDAPSNEGGRELTLAERLDQLQDGDGRDDPFSAW